MPDAGNVLKRLPDPMHKDFEVRYARAKQDQAETKDAKILHLADEVSAGRIDPHAARVVIRAYMWRAGKLHQRSAATALKSSRTSPSILARIAEARHRATTAAGRGADHLLVSAGGLAVQPQMPICY